MGIVSSKRASALLFSFAIGLALAGQLSALSAGIVATAETDPKTGEFIVSHSVDGGKTWTKPFAVAKNGSAVKAYKLSTEETPPAIAWIESSGSLSKVFYTAAAPGYPVSELIALPEIDAIDLTGIIRSSPFVIFSGGNILYASNSVDSGKNWSRAKTFSMERPAHSLKCTAFPGGISVITDSGSAEPVMISAPSAPGFLSAGDLYVSSSEIEQPFVPSPGAEKNAVAYLFEVSADKEFLNPVSSTLEGEMIKTSLPQDFRHGTYFCRIAAWNGLEKTYSGVKLLHLTAASTAPEIKLIKPSDTDWLRSGSVAAIELAAADPQDDIADETEAKVWLNGATIEASLAYDKMSGSITGFASIPKNAPNGTNILQAEIRDSSGNKGTTEAKISVDSIAPALGLTLINNTAYSNSRDRVFVPLKDSGAGADLHNSSVRLFYSGATVEGTQSADGAIGSIVFTPKVLLMNNDYTVELYPRDLAGNRGEKITFTLVIDQTVPNISLDPSTPETTASMFTLSGIIDKKNLASVSIQNNSSPAKAVPVSNGRFSAGIELNRGQNLIKITVTDLAGNCTAAAAAVHLSAPPDTVFFRFDDKIVLDGDFISSTASAKITDDTGAGISGGEVKIDGTPVPYDEATGLVSAGPFSSGTHTIALTAGIKAYSLSFSSQDSLKINSALACPNPFSPSGGNTDITYNVSKDSEISAYIFDAVGTLVWKRNVSALLGFNNNISWDGRSLDGRALSNGVYIVRLMAKDPAGNISACSGKIVILK